MEEKVNKKGRKGLLQDEWGMLNKLIKNLLQNSGMGKVKATRELSVGTVHSSGIRLSSSSFPLGCSSGIRMGQI